MLHAIVNALQMAGIMAWEILWALILGFVLSAVMQAVVSKEEMSSLLPDDRAGTILKACGLGTASSSCSYAAVALARCSEKEQTSRQLWPFSLHLRILFLNSAFCWLYSWAVICSSRLRSGV
jgi:uncharacterized membrane protein YraQ (UPF0718 family)